ncbi:MAG TPA: AarF/ABC1/UbiB kinase family protein [Mycobacteriales bacterium]|nr:AarF/ABC1/UbiB kinase family protein [Mycobacteriales bacterium]
MTGGEDGRDVGGVPRRAIVRSAKLATLPLGVAGRLTVGVGKRIGGKPAELVAHEIQVRTAEQLFRVLGQLKGGAMKAGQALSIFEAALPEDVAAPYRAVLQKLQEAAPPLPTATVHRVLDRELGRAWRSSFIHFDDKPAAAASIGQVHKAVWKDGREVAVKIQYPGAGDALVADLRQLGRMARLFGVISPGLDVKPLITELMDRVTEELDYQLEARSQRTMAEAFRGDGDIYVPDVVASADRVLITEWVDGIPLAKIINEGTPEQRDRAGQMLVRFLYSAPARAGLLHADPHPGNFRLLADDRLAAIDFGAVNRLPDGLPEPIGRLARLAVQGEGEQVLAGLRELNFVREGFEVDAEAVLDYVRPLLQPVMQESFTYSRAWLREQAARLADPRSPANQLGRQLNLPPYYMLIHRVTLGTVGVLCQLGATIHSQHEMQWWLPGFADPDSEAGRHAHEANRPGRPLPSGEPTSG